ncbi:MAG TPA: tetratricopeptide repeat protein, partial [Acidobacteriaceae bacterium]
MCLASLLLFIARRDSHPLEAQEGFERAQRLFLRGELEKSQQEAARGYERWRLYNPERAAGFQTLESEAMLWRGQYEDALSLLSASPLPATRQDTIRRLTVEVIAYTRLHQFDEAEQKLNAATQLCANETYAVCGETTSALGILAIERGQLDDAEKAFLTTLSFARSHKDSWLEATALLNLGVTSMQLDHLDEAVDWSNAAYRAASGLGALDLAQRSLGNLGWAYAGMGDSEKALANFLEAEKSATRLGDTLFQIKWLSTEGYVYQGMGDLERAASSDQQALKLALKINSKEDIINTLEDLAHFTIQLGQPDEASRYLGQLSPLVKASANKLDDLDVMLAQGEIAAARRQDQQAAELFKKVEAAPESQISMRLGAEHQLANLYEREGDITSADRMYRTALSTFESARQQLKKEASKLPFLANATPIYTDYIGFLIKQGKA